MFILTIDQGTTGTTTAIFDKETNLVKKAYRSFRQIYPQPGWVEHDPMEIWQTVLETTNELLSDFSGEITAVGITNQRETTILWDKKTGKPIHNAIVWQCRRTASICEQFHEHESSIREKTGLPLDAYFSATKVKWILENNTSFNMEDLLFGTVDTWLIWMLTAGKVHATDYTNASRTMMFNIKDLIWDDELLTLFNISKQILPQVKNSADDYGVIDTIPALAGIPILGVAGDQQSALFGQKCFNSGQVKNTYGTGCFLLMNTGNQPVFSQKGLITTLAIDSECQPCYAMEGSIFIAGAVIQWLRDELQVIESAEESEQIAESVPDNAGVYFVPAFVGLGAPHWDSSARGTISGLTRGCTKAHIVRAGLESMAYQTNDVLDLMEKETGIKLESLAVDGGATANNFLMQFQANILDRSVIRPNMVELTALGAASLAGLKAGIWQSSDELFAIKGKERLFTPQMNNSDRKILLNGWRRALNQTLSS